MVTLDMIRKPVEGDLEAFEQFIRQKFTADGTLLSEMLDYALSARGKGIRPMTVLLSAALNAPAGQRSGGLRTLLAATLVEMIHVASLIHDDVIDESDMRRGRASVNARWQSRNAVVVGDYILAKNMDLGLKSGQFDLVTHVCGAIATLCEGEILQNDKANRQEMTRASYLDIIYKKTACLIGVSASAGALAVGASREKQALMRKFGESIGMAFQIQDDLLNLIGTEEATRKDFRGDITEGKRTLVAVHALSDERYHDEVEAILSSGTDDPAQLARAVEIFQETGSIDYAHTYALDLTAKAKAAIENVELDPHARELFLSMADFFVERLS
mgnify:CR=1 FL=1